MRCQVFLRLSCVCTYFILTRLCVCLLCMRVSLVCTCTCVICVCVPQEITLEECCAVCIEPYAAGDYVRVLPCRYVGEGRRCVRVRAGYGW